MVLAVKQKADAIYTFLFLVFKDQRLLSFSYTLLIPIRTHRDYEAHRFKADRNPELKMENGHKVPLLNKKLLAADSF